MAEMRDLLDLLPGKKVIVSDCEASSHDGGVGCLCELKGHVVTVGQKYETMFAGTPTWWLELPNNDKRVRLSEITILKDQS